MTTHHARTTTATLALLTAAAITGCGSSSPGALPTLATAPATVAVTAAPDIVPAVIDAARHGGPVHLTGTYTPPQDESDSGSASGETSPSPHMPAVVTLDVRGTADRFRATFDFAGVHLELIRVGDQVAARGNGEAARLLARPGVASGWVRLPATEPALEPWLRLADVPGLVESVLTGADYSLEPGIVATSGDVLTHPQLNLLRDSAVVGTVTLATPGEPLPLSIVAGDATGSGRFTLSDWGVPTDVQLPT